MTIGENIRLHRKEKGITQKKLAELVSLNEVTIRGYEAGKYKPKIENLKKIADVLCVPLEALDENFRNIGNLLETVKLKNSLEKVYKEREQYDSDEMQDLLSILKMQIEDLEIDIAEYEHILNEEVEWLANIKKVYTDLEHEAKKTLKNIVLDFNTLNEDGRITLIEQIELLKKVPDYRKSSV